LPTRASVRRKITVSVPAELLDFVERKAQLQRRSRSEVIGNCLAAAKEAEEKQLAAEGYRFYAEEARGFAEASATAVAEAISGGG